MGQTPDEIRREIEETRERMGETAQAIAAKLNVPARVKGRIGEMKGEVAAVIRTFGARINFHPHIHVLVTEGGAAPECPTELLDVMSRRRAFGLEDEF